MRVDSDWSSPLVVRDHLALEVFWLVSMSIHTFDDDVLGANRVSQLLKLMGAEVK